MPPLSAISIPSFLTGLWMVSVWPPVSTATWPPLTSRPPDNVPYPTIELFVATLIDEAKTVPCASTSLLPTQGGTLLPIDKDPVLVTRPPLLTISSLEAPMDPTQMSPLLFHIEPVPVIVTLLLMPKVVKPTPKANEATSGEPTVPPLLMTWPPSLITRLLPEFCPPIRMVLALLQTEPLPVTSTALSFALELSPTTPPNIDKKNGGAVPKTTCAPLLMVNWLPEPE